VDRGGISRGCRLQKRGSALFTVPMWTRHDSCYAAKTMPTPIFYLSTMLTSGRLKSVIFAGWFYLYRMLTGTVVATSKIVPRTGKSVKFTKAENRAQQLRHSKNRANR
jgi:hypothetical protein